MQRIGKKIALTVTPVQEERVAKIAKRLNIPQAKVYRNMIDVGLDLYDDFEKIGAVKLMEFTEKTRKAGKDFIAKRQPRLF